MSRTLGLILRWNAYLYLLSVSRETISTQNSILKNVYSHFFYIGNELNC